MPKNFEFDELQNNDFNPMICYEGLFLNEWMHHDRPLILANHSRFGKSPMMSGAFVSTLRSIASLFGKELILVSNSGVSGHFSWNPPQTKVTLVRTTALLKILQMQHDRKAIEQNRVF